MKIGIIGFGRMGITHFSIINSHPDVEVIAVADPASNILSILNKYIESIRISKDYNTILEEMKIDAVLVCTPPHLHYNILKKAAERGVHVFVEKPFTANESEAKELSDIFEKNNLVNQVGYVNRFNDVFKKVKELIEKSLIGKIIRFRSEMFSCTINKKNDESSWRGSHKKGGGVVFEMASHAIDLVNYIIGQPEKTVGTSMNQLYSTVVEDIVSSTFLYKNNITGTIYVNWSDDSYRKPTNNIEILGSKGKILADQHGLKIYLNNEGKGSEYRKGWNTVYITDIFTPVPFYVRGNEFTRQLYHFIELIQGHRKENLSSFSDALKTQTIIKQMYDDFNQNGIIS